MAAFLPPLTISHNSLSVPLPLRNQQPQPLLSPLHSPRAQLPDVLVVGGGAAGLSTAYELAQRGLQVRVLSTPTYPPALAAAAGMLAPHEELEEGPLLKFCQKSLSMYPSFVQQLRAHAPDVDVGFISRGDFLHPYYEDEVYGDDVISGDVARQLEPMLSEHVVAALQRPLEASVDNRKLQRALQLACKKLGVYMEEQTVSQIRLAKEHALGVVLANGDFVSAGHIVVAGGSWTGKLLPFLPVRPIKGQMLSLHAPPFTKERLRHVLYARDCYLVPRGDGDEVVVGATVEDGVWSTEATGRGVRTLLEAAGRLVPALDAYIMGETWAGLRPTTPDFMPILGGVGWKNVSVATGFHRNGVLLIPAAAEFVADHVCGGGEMEEFRYDRFWKGEEEREAVKHEVNQKRDGQMVGVADVNVAGRNGTADEGGLGDIKVWRVLKDGTKEPVYPSQKAIDEGIASAKSRPSMSPAPVSPNSIAETSTSSFSYQKTVENPEAVSGRNDAYEDVMQHREEWERTMSEAMAANRAFGRTKSSLEKDGVPPLSISEEEVMRFDEALLQGVEDMKLAESTFDQRHASVIATKAELARERTKEVNGKTNTLFEAGFGGGDGENTTTAGYY